MKASLIKLIQTALNRYLALDPESKIRLRALEGKIVTLQLRGLGLTFQLFFSDEQVEFHLGDSFKADTLICGTPLTLLRMTLTKDDRKQFFSDDVLMEGNLELGQKVIDLFDRLEIDWEEYASHCIGDISAHQVGRVVRGVTDFVKRLHDTLQENTTEFVHEEIDLFPPKEAIEDHLADVDIIRMDVDRLEARVAELRRSLK